LEILKNVDSFFKQDLIKVKVIFQTTRIKYGEIWGENHREASIKTFHKAPFK
jgi:hypothetical protein